MISRLALSHHLWLYVEKLVLYVCDSVRQGCYIVSSILPTQVAMQLLHPRFLEWARSYLQKPNPVAPLRCLGFLVYLLITQLNSETSIQSRLPSRLCALTRAAFSCSVASASCRVCACGVMKESCKGGTAVDIGGGDMGLLCIDDTWSSLTFLLGSSSFGETTVTSERCEGVGVTRPIAEDLLGSYRASEALRIQSRLQD